MSGIHSKITRQEDINNNENIHRNQPNTDTDIRITDKDIKTAIINTTVFRMFKKTQKIILKDPNLPAMKNILDWINGTVNTEGKLI